MLLLIGVVMARRIEELALGMRDKFRCSSAIVKLLHLFYLVF
jgi:hypothetical protein